MQLNKNEQKVIEILDKDCRTPAKQIAKQSNLSAEGVNKIINRLVQREIINLFHLRINYTRMGFDLYPFVAKLPSLTQDEKNKLIKIMRDSPCCQWFSFCEGEYDLMYSLKSTLNKKEIIKFQEEMSKYALDQEAFIVNEASEFSKIFDESDVVEFVAENDENSMEISEFEDRLINLLRTNARMPIISIAKELDASSQKIISSIKKLRKSGIITGFKLRLDLTKLNYAHAHAIIKCEGLNSQKIKQFKDYCKYKSTINYYIHQFGKYDFNITINAKTMSEFYETLEDIRQKFNFVKRISTLIDKEK